MIMNRYWRQYLGDSLNGPPNYRFASLRAPDNLLKSAPPAMILTAEADVLRDDGEAFACKLRLAGVSVSE